MTHKYILQKTAYLLYIFFVFMATSTLFLQGEGAARATAHAKPASGFFPSMINKYKRYRKLPAYKQNVSNPKAICRSHALLRITAFLSGASMIALLGTKGAAYFATEASPQEKIPFLPPPATITAEEEILTKELFVDIDPSCKEENITPPSAIPVLQEPISTPPPIATVDSPPLEKVAPLPPPSSPADELPSTVPTATKTLEETVSEVFDTTKQKVQILKDKSKKRIDQFMDENPKFKNTLQKFKEKILSHP